MAGFWPFSAWKAKRKEKKQRSEAKAKLKESALGPKSKESTTGAKNPDNLTNITGVAGASSKNDYSYQQQQQEDDATSNAHLEYSVPTTTMAAADSMLLCPCSDCWNKS